MLQFCLYLQIVLDRIKTVQHELRREYPERSDLFLNPLALEKVLNQLVNGEVHICVIGRTNAGKSTVINALLNET